MLSCDYSYSRDRETYYLLQQENQEFQEKLASWQQFQAMRKHGIQGNEKGAIAVFQPSSSSQPVSEFSYAPVQQENGPLAKEPVTYDTNAGDPEDLTRVDALYDKPVSSVRNTKQHGTRGANI